MHRRSWATVALVVISLAAVACQPRTTPAAPVSPPATEAPPTTPPPTDAPTTEAPTTLAPTTTTSTTTTTAGPTTTTTPPPPATLSSISVGATHSCAVLSDGTISCVGTNSSGELGDGTQVTPTGPVTVSGITNAVAVSSGDRHTCAIVGTGTVKCWGYNFRGQLGNASTILSTTPVTVSGITTAVSISAGIASSCAVLADGTAACWGYRQYGQLGDGSTSSLSTVPVAVTGITDASQVRQGTNFACALRTTGAVSCWGLNDHQQLGTASGGSSSTPITTTVAGATSLATGRAHACVVVMGTPQCWGADQFGQLGNAVHPDSATPVVVAELTTALTVSATERSSCAQLADHSVRCWGDGVIGSSGGSAVSPTVLTASVSSSISASTGAGCSLLQDGTVTCWPSASTGHDDATPAAIGSLTASSISHGTHHACAVLTDGTVSCWGSNASGQLGLGVTGGTAWSPAVVPGITTATAVAAGDASTCALLADTSVSCWGRGASGELGNGATLDSPNPVAVSGLTGVTAITVGTGFACAIEGVGDVQCWGSQASGQLGNGVTTGVSSVPVPTGTITDATLIDAGDSHACAVTTTDGVVCWGDAANGRLGNDELTGVEATPVIAVDGVAAPITTATSMSAGATHTCVTTSTGQVLCWGSEAAGQLGDGATSTDVGHAVEVAVDATGPVSTMAGTTCYLAATETKCVGDNTHLQLAVAGAAPSLIWVSIGSAVDDVSIGGGSACTLAPDDSVTCWGAGDLGQLGGGLVPTLTPVTGWS